MVMMMMMMSGDFLIDSPSTCAVMPSHSSPTPTAAVYRSFLILSAFIQPFFALTTTDKSAAFLLFCVVSGRKGDKGEKNELFACRALEFSPVGGTPVACQPLLWHTIPLYSFPSWCVQRHVVISRYIYIYIRPNISCRWTLKTRFINSRCRAHLTSATVTPYSASWFSKFFTFGIRSQLREEAGSFCFLSFFLTFFLSFPISFCLLLLFIFNCICMTVRII